MHLPSYLTILRPSNALMASVAVVLGAWMSGSFLQWHAIAVLSIVTFFATGFGNVINDVIDVETDRISHPSRPIPSGKMSRRAAIVYSILLALFSITAAGIIAPLYGIAAFVPLLLLTLYALFLKGTPLIGNVIVSVLVAYALLFGSLEAPMLRILVVPALLAMLLNFSREIIKDIQDREGDRTAGITTTASLPLPLLKKLLYGVSIAYAFVLALPLFLRMYGLPYGILIIALVIPLHCIRLFRFRKPDWTNQCGQLSKLIKIEMLCGLLALAVDRLAG